MSVNIQCKRRCCVSKILLNGLHVVSCLKRGHSKTVPKIMKTRFRDPRSRCNRLEMLHNSTPHKILSGLIRKDQMEWIIP